MVWFERREVLREMVLEHGAFAPIAFIFLQILQIVFSPVPGEATGLMGGFLFGEWEGFIYSTIGLSIGSMAAFFIARQFRKLLKPWLMRSVFYERFETLVEHQGVFLCFLLFVLPGFPKDFLCYLLGLSRMNWMVFCFIASVGRIPGTIMLSWQGAAIYDGNFAALLAMAVLIVVVLLPAWIVRERLYEWLEQHRLEE